MRATGFWLGCLLLGLSGCQCCPLTESYATAIDVISDHEHHFERVYVAGLDLNRIGRPDWCSYRINHLFCPCVCDRCRPAPCGYVVQTERYIPPTQISQPDWAQEESEPTEPATVSPDVEPDRNTDPLLLPGNGEAEATKELELP